MLYNPSDHLFHKLANKIKKAAVTVFSDLAVQLSHDLLLQHNEQQDASISLEPSNQCLQPLLDRDPGNERDRLAQLFAYELFPPPPPSPLPKIRIPRPPPQKREPGAKRDPLRVTASARTTRSAGPSAIETPIDQEMLPKELRNILPKSKPKRPAAKPTPSESAIQSRETTGLASESADDSLIVIPLRRPETGVLGKMVYSPMTDQERRAKEKQMSLVVDEVDLKETFSRFNVGYVLPEGSKRRGRTALPPPPVAGPSKPRQRESTGFFHDVTYRLCNCALEQKRRSRP